MFWFPVNEHPSDKAKICTKIAVPKGLQAVSNGLAGARTDHPQRVDDLPLVLPRPDGLVPGDGGDRQVALRPDADRARASRC